MVCTKFVLRLVRFFCISLLQRQPTDCHHLSILPVHLFFFLHERFKFIPFSFPRRLPFSDSDLGYHVSLNGSLLSYFISINSYSKLIFRVAEMKLHQLPFRSRLSNQLSQSLRPTALLRPNRSTVSSFNSRRARVLPISTRTFASVSAADLQFGQPVHETHPHMLQAGERTCLLLWH